MDIVIPFKHSINGDEELRYTLRSMEVHLFGAEHVWIIGDAPKWLYKAENLTIIPHLDLYPEEKFRDRNMVNKLLTARSISDIPEVFLVGHDDNFILAPCDIDIWPWYHCGSDWKASGDYAKTVTNTRELLGSRVNNYDVHAPHIMSKSRMEVLKDVNWKIEYGYCIKTLYCVRNNIDGEFCTDLKIRAQYDLPEIERRITAGRRFFSCHDMAFTPGVRQWLKLRFPNPSKYERARTKAN